MRVVGKEQNVALFDTFPGVFYEEAPKVLKDSLALTGGHLRLLLTISRADIPEAGLVGLIWPHDNDVFKCLTES